MICLERHLVERSLLEWQRMVVVERLQPLQARLVCNRRLPLLQQLLLQP